MSIGGVDTTYINSTTKSIIDAQKADGSVASNNDTNGQRIFMNLGNVNGGNSDDFTDGAGTALANGIGAGTFTAQDVADAKDQVYTSDNFFQSIMLVSMSSFTDIIERVADARAENGAEQNRLGMVNELLTQNQTNLEAAYGRIMDADIALESTRYARQNVLVQSSAAMVAQANQLTNIALAILG